MGHSKEQAESSNVLEMDVDLTKLNLILNKYQDTKGNIIAVLQQAQDAYGYLSLPMLNYIAKEMNMNSAKVYGIATFYSYFNMEPKGKYAINVCLGTACFVRGAEKIVQELHNALGIDLGQTTEDGQFSLDGLRCVGACGLAPVVMVNGKIYGKVLPKDVAKILSDYKIQDRSE